MGAVRADRQAGIGLAGRATDGPRHGGAEAAGECCWPRFYRVENGRRQFLGVDGVYHDLVRAPGVLLLEDIKLASKPVLKNGSAALWDIGDGVLCFEFTTKSNALDDQIIALLGKSIALVGRNTRRW